MPPLPKITRLLLLLPACGALLPTWSVPPFDATPLAGLAPLPNGTASVPFFGSAREGGYNHGAMLALGPGLALLTLSWKNGLNNSGEDAAGQRVRYSQSADGLAWTPSAILFPSLSTSALPVALFAGPFALLGGRLYASATPAVIATGDAQGSQFCLWPDGVDPRNAGPPGQRQPVGTLLLRRVAGLGQLGPLFWAARAVPAGFGPASQAAGILTLDAMDAQTQGDMAGLLRADLPALPCADPRTGGTLKCEAVRGGAQDYESLPLSARLANERAHWAVPQGAPHAGRDVLVYRSHSSALWAASRAPGATAWSAVALTGIPNDDSNINAGALPGGAGAFLVANAVPHRGRDPLTIAFARDGLNFTAARWLLTCRQPPFPGNQSCTARGPGGASGGPSYPQALTVIPPAAAQLEGFYVASTLNKEDVVVVKYPLASLLEVQ
jgi:hypothetical protein